MNCFHGSQETGKIGASGLELRLRVAAQGSGIED